VANYLKRGMDPMSVKEADQKVRETVETILTDIEDNGDAAVGALSEKFDNWAPESFRLSESEIEAAMSKVAKRDLEDIRFAQEQVRNFAHKQREALQDVDGLAQDLDLFF